MTTGSASWDLATFAGMSSSSEGTDQLQPSKSSNKIIIWVSVPVRESALTCIRVHVCDGTTYVPTDETRVDRSEKSSTRSWRSWAGDNTLVESKLVEAIEQINGLNTLEALEGFECE
jgi:hypothetical protein